ncbi:MAG: double-strand break repair helicase AddA [Alphaproteobacteria bacterium]|nr:double-strand break repair helicase AddA [Alphaproteobacteria bacterium]
MIEELLQPVNKQQQKASDPTKSVWVGASAGSGKTKVLADRVLRLLLSGVLPQRILCLTFTRAAAAQMSIRVTEQLSFWATCSEEELREALFDLHAEALEPKQIERARSLFSRVLNCPGGMRIRTIHAFAQEILRRFPLEAGVSPHFVLLDDAEDAVLKNEARREMFCAVSKNRKSREGLAFDLLIKDMGDKSLFSVLEEVTSDMFRLEAALSKAGGIEKLVEKLRALLGLKPREDEKSILRDAVSDDAFMSDDIRNSAKWLQGGTESEKKKGAAIGDWLSLTVAKRAKGFESYCRLFLTEKWQPFAKPANKKVREAHPEIVDILNEEAARLINVRARLSAVYTVEKTRAILLLAVAVGKKYAAHKAVRSVLTYDDIINCANKLLRKDGIAPWALFKLDGGIDHIMVDEAQDTSPAQWQIISVLADEFFNDIGAKFDRNRTLFVVGDEKQSIYSFLKADPAMFSEMREHFRSRITEMDKNAYSEIPLNVSFRSAPAILRAVDAIFKNEDVRRGVSAENIAHHAFRRDAVGRVEVWPIVALEKEKDKLDEEWTLSKENERDSDAASVLATNIADKIEKWIASGAIVRGRAVQPGDVMILVRRRNSFVDHMVRALKERDIPVTGVDRMKLAEQLAVMDLVALLQFTLLPEDDLNLATVLRGPLLGLSEEDLMALAAEREGSLWSSLKATGAFAAAADYLHRWLARADKVSPFVMLAEILSAPCPSDKVSGRRAIWSRLGPDALDPMDELLNAAQEFGTMRSPSLQAFLHWLMVAKTEVKREMDQSGGRVRITTVHAAKGLEAPIVILPDTTKLPDRNKLSKFLWSEKENAPFFVNKDSCGSLLMGLRDSAWQKQMEEYRRLFYVALTRASDQLYICGWNNSKSDGSGLTWYDMARQALAPLRETADDDEVIAFADPDMVASSIEKQSPEKPDNIVLPEWVYCSAPGELPQSRRLAPSHQVDESVSPGSKGFARGKVVHRLLQNLPDMAPEKQEAAARRFLADPQHGLSKSQQDEVMREVMKLLHHADFAPLFGAGSRAEVPVIGRWGDVLIDGQVDRICVSDDAVWIVDYKTNRNPPAMASDAPKSYLRQMAAYRAVLAEIYPRHTMRCFLLWTQEPRLMLIPDELLTLGDIIPI